MQRQQLGDRKYNNECKPIYTVNRLRDQRFDLVTIEQVEFWWSKLSFIEKLWLWINCHEQCKASSIKFHGLLTFGLEISSEHRAEILLFNQEALMLERDRTMRTLKVQ